MTLRLKKSWLAGRDCWEPSLFMPRKWALSAFNIKIKGTTIYAAAAATAAADIDGR